MTEGVGYLGSYIDNYKHQGLWNEPRGHNVLDGGAHFYRCYETLDKKYMAVGRYFYFFNIILIKMYIN